MPVSEQLKGAVQAVVDFTDAEELCTQLHPLLLALWKTQWEATENHVIYDSTMCFLALSSLEKTGEFTGPKKTTGPIAKLCWGIKLCMLKEIHELVNSGRCKDQLEAFKMIAPFVIEHELTTFHHLRSLTHYATTLAYTTMEAPSIIWTDRETWREMLYLGEKISLEQLQQVLGKLEAEIVELGEDRILLNLDLHVKYGELSDNLANTNPGYSFITNPLNPFAEHRHSFINAMQKKPHLAGYFLYKASGVAELQLNMDYARTWLCDLAEFEGLLMLYTELTPGALIRWTELASLHMQNTQYRLRNALGVGKFLAVVRQYDKTTNTAQKDRFIPHAASGFVADLLIQLHTFARPFAQFLASRVFPGEPDTVGMYADLLFMNFGKQFTSDKLSALMAQWTAPVLGWDMTIQPFRQINTAFRRKHCRSAQLSTPIASMVQVFQAGHGKAVDTMHYGRTHNPLLGITDEVMFAFLEGSVSWQKLLEVVPGGLALPYYYAIRKYFSRVVLDSKPKPQKISKVPEGVDPSVSQLLSDLMESQRAMEKSQEAMLAQIKRMEQALHSRPAQQAQAQLPWAQQLSHLLAPVPVPVPTAAAAPLSPMLTPAQSEDSPMDDIVDLTLVDDEDEDLLGPSPPYRDDQEDLLEPSTPYRDLLDSLKELYSPDAGWKDKLQYDGVKALLDLERDVILAVKTGGGKTLMPVLASRVENAYTVIVLPLKSLMDDWERRLQGFGIPYERWMGAERPYLDGCHNLILVSSDMAAMKSFKTAISELNAQRPVNRWVFDEVQHYYMDEDFRAPAFQDPFELRRFDTQVVLMSATAPPSARAYLAEKFFLVNPLCISNTSDRPELVTRISDACKTWTEQLIAAHRVVNSCKQNKRWNKDSHYLIFVNSWVDGKAVARDFGLDFYHADSTAHPIEDTERRGRYQKMISGEKDGLVCTTALAAGMDYPHVRLTIHIGLPRNATIFKQQAERVGRDGQIAWNFIGISRKGTKPWEIKDNDDLAGTQFMWDFVHGEPRKCYTWQMTGFMDGTARSCTDLQRELPCEICKVGESNANL
ncbi:hypothetical protein C8J57DRAFT_1193345 [Mycena rebaudengoi]|nr:hypothetical protein C8J57DRAFT_1193345 [Mycena rebaudengoi]